MKKIIFSLFTIFCLLTTTNYLLPTIVYATEFLKIGYGARARGMSGAFTGVADDVSSIYWNVAGLSFLQKQELILSYNESFMGIKNGFIGYAYPDKIGSIGVSVIYLTAGEIIGRDDRGRLTNNFTSYDFAISFGYSKEISDGISIGMNLKYINEKIEETNATGFGVDIGFLMYISEEIKAGISIENIGSRIKFVSEEENLPYTTRIGIAYEGIENLIIAIDMNKYNDDKDWIINIGAEYNIEFIFLRVGYSFDKKRENIPISIGAGISLKSYFLDYSFHPYYDLGISHNFSIRIKF